MRAHSLSGANVIGIEDNVHTITSHADVATKSRAGFFPLLFW
jgi:hypothetical protein